MQPSTCADAAPFALRVLDDSMEPEFRRHCIVIIDPTGHARDGAYVLAEIEGETIFRRLRMHGDRVWLEALKDIYPALALDAGIAAVKGVVVQRAGTRRRYHKRYD
jgi:SOS-response transcriptional repressor LexA